MKAAFTQFIDRIGLREYADSGATITGDSKKLLNANGADDHGGN